MTPQEQNCDLVYCPKCHRWGGIDALPALPPTDPGTTLVEAIAEQERREREALWSVCPHDGKYGDDGEMQCREADFRRNSRHALMEHVRQAVLPPTDPQAPRPSFVEALALALHPLRNFMFASDGNVNDCDEIARQVAAHPALAPWSGGSVVHAAGDPPAPTEEAVADALDRAIERRDEYIEQGKGIPTPLATLIWEELIGRKSEYTAMMSGATPEEPEPRVLDHDTTFAWLIERGQPEGQTPPVWFVYGDRATGYDWTTDANKATKYATREEAEAAIDAISTNPYRWGRAVEHGFMAATPEPGPRQAAAATGDER